MKKGVIYFAGEEADKDTEFDEFVSTIRKELDEVEKTGAAELILPESDEESVEEPAKVSGGIAEFIEN